MKRAIEKLVVVALLAGCAEAKRPEFELGLDQPRAETAVTKELIQDLRPESMVEGARSVGEADRIRKPLTKVPPKFDVAFDETPVSEIAKAVYSDQLQMSVVLVGDLSKRVTWRGVDDDYQTVKGSAEAAIRAAGYSLEYAGRAVIIGDQAGDSAGGEAEAILSLRRVPPSVVADAVAAAIGSVTARPVGTRLVVTGRTEDVRRATRIVEALDIDAGLTAPWAIVRLPRSVAQNASETLAAIGATSQGLPVEVYAIGETGVVFVAGYTQEAVTAATDILKGMAASLQNTVVRTVEVQRPETVIEAVNTLFEGEIANGDLDAAALVEIGAISLRGDPTSVAGAMRFIKSANADETWISVKVIIAETRRGSAVDRGVTLGFTSGGFSFGVGGGGDVPQAVTDPRALSVGINTSGFSAALRWLESDAETVVLSTPSVHLNSGAEALLNVGAEVPILRTQTTALDGETSVTQSIEYRSTGVVLGVTANALVDGRISLALQQETTAASNNTFSAVDSPVFDTRALTTQVVLEPGEVAAIAGLDSASFQTDNAGVGLRVLPALFASESGSASKLVMLVSADYRKPKQRQTLAQNLIGGLKVALNER